MTEREYENAAEEAKIPSRSSKHKKKEKSALREMAEVVVVAFAKVLQVDMMDLLEI